MNYSQSLQYLDSFQNFERMMLPGSQRLWNLKRTACLLEAFGHPERSFRCVTVGGTKGKGSTGFWLESMLHESGIPVGFYCSPHLETPRERIRINGRMVSPRLWAKVFAEVRRGLRGHPVISEFGEVTYFEIMTVAALLMFQRSGVKVAVLEVGMGGRLDATNAVKAPLILMTPIGLDHQQFLGETVSEIAAEKAELIHASAAVLSAPQVPAAWTVIARKAAFEGAKLDRVSPLKNLRVGLAGDFQRTNAALAKRALEWLSKDCDFPVSQKAVCRALARQSWPGRLEPVAARSRRWILDVAHNPDSIGALAAHLKSRPEKPSVLLYGAARDKDSAVMLKLLAGVFSTVIVAEFKHGRSEKLARLMECAGKYFERVFPAGSPAEALTLAGRLTAPGGEIVVTGSFYLVGDVRRELRRG